MEIKQAVFAELDAGHARPRDPRLEHLLAVDHRDRRSDAAPGEGRRLPLLLPGVDHAADRDRRGRGDLGRDGQRGGHVRAGDPQAADHLRRGPRLRRQPHPQLGHRRGVARAGGEGPVDQEDRRGRSAPRASCRSALPPRQPARPRHRAARRRAPGRVLRRGTLLRPQGHAEARRRRQARREDRRRRLLRPAGRAEHRRRRRAGHRGARRAALAEDASSRPAWCSRRASPPTATSTSG